MIKSNSTSTTKPTNKEWLLTNGLGGYAASTLSGANTRRYHGLLVAALNPPTGRMVVVFKLEERLTADNGIDVELSTNHYPGVVHPQGFKYLKEFERKTLPTFHYDAHGAKLLKRLFMPHGSNTTMIEYENAGDSPFQLHLTPLFMYRDYHSLFLKMPILIIT